MYDPDTIEFAQELGVDPAELSSSDPYADDPAAALHQYRASYPFQYDDLQDDIENSSPSPAERRVAPRMTRTIERQAVYQDPYIEEFEDENQDVRRGYKEQYRHEDSFSHQSQQAHYRTPLNDYANQSTSRQPQTQNGFGSRLPQQNNTNGRQFQPFTDHAQDRSLQQSNELQGPPFSARNESQFSQSQTDFNRRENPRNSHGTRLRPVSELPDIYRGMYKFGVFNAVQSTCFDTVLHSDDSAVISAPTGSGKTVLFELAIIRMLTEAHRTGRLTKCVYMAPTKALCSERHRDWTTKFDALGIKCCELTGDTIQAGKGAWGDAKSASIIITTGEKWDSLTRHWEEHGNILSQIQLFLVDEVHILNESRGSTLEVVVSRMKARGSDVRFVLVSATVPNVDDVASWIGGTNNGSAKIFEFGEEYRPCKLTRFVYPISKSKGANDWVFASLLDQKLFPILQKHSVDKPIMVFCPTRKGCVQTAQVLAKEYDKAVQSRGSLPWSQPTRIDYQFNDKVLAELALAGIGVHHAGLSLDDRRATEELFLKKILRVIVSTSTLAVGVNLPAHTVVIKGVKVFQNNTTKEYSDLDVMQMMGRAGRPQFDKDGTAIILCEPELEQKYKNLANGTTKLESSLHLNLDEHLNSEIGLGTITNLQSAKGWLRNSFLWRRLQKNPKHYAIGKGDGETWQEKIDELVLQSVTKLKETELVEYESSGDGELCSTEYGDIMSKFYIRQSTMSLILKLPKSATLREMMEMVSASDELADLKIRASEKPVYDKLRQHGDIRYEIKKVQKTGDKVFLLVQAVLSGISLNSPEYKKGDSQPQLEVLTIFRHVTRVARAIVEVAIAKKSGAQIKHSLEMLRCLTAKAWEDRPVVLRQLDQIGEKSLKAAVLAEHGINSLQTLLKQTPFRIETLLNRRPPFGFEVLASARELPEYFLNITEVNVAVSTGDDPVEVELSIECSLAVDQSTSVLKVKKQKGRSANMTTVLTLTSDLDFIDFRRIPTKALKNTKTFSVNAQLLKPSQSITVCISSETIAGISVSRVYKPRINPNQFPTMDTRPRSNLEMDLMGLEENADFWKMGIDDEDEEIIPIKDLTKQRRDQRSTPLKLDTRKPTGKAVPALLQALDRNPVELSKLPNGNYECNHPCKDKTKCRHFCCRDGLSEPPASKKRITNTATTDMPKAKTISFGESPPAKKKLKKAPARSDKTLQQLKTLHESVNVKKSIGIRDGQRLKLDSSFSSSAGPSRRRPKAPPPHFNLTFADLDNGPLTGEYNLEHGDNDDDDLPDIHELLHPITAKPKRPPSSGSNYSNSEIDALIRDIPLDSFDKQAEPTLPSLNTDLQASPKYAPISSNPLRPLKRARTPESGNSTKRTKRILDSTQISPKYSSPMRQRRKEKKRSQTPLFVPEHTDEDAQEDEQDSRSLTNGNSQSRKDVVFALDYSLFDIIPDTLNLTTDTISFGDGAEPSYTKPSALDASTPVKRSKHSMHYSPKQTPHSSFSLDTSAFNIPSTARTLMKSPVSSINVPNSSSNILTKEPEFEGVKVADVEQNRTIVYDNALAELEEWLQSGAVIITD